MASPIPHPNVQTGRHGVLAVASCALTTALTLPLADRVDAANIVLLFVLDVVLVATFLGRSSAILASFVAVACFDYFFVPPRYSFTVAHAQSLVVFGVMLVVSLIITHLATAYRAKALEAQSRAGESALLHRLAEALSGATSIEAVAEQLVDVCRERLAAEAALFLVGADEESLHVLPGNRHVDPGVELAVRSVWLEGRMVEANVDLRDRWATTLLPLDGSTRRRGVMAVQMPEDGSVKPGRALLAAMAAVVTTALERIHFVDVAHASTLRWQTEQQRSAILATLSHDLRTPLTVLFRLADSLAHDGRLTPEDHARVLQLRDQSHGLHRLVDNLLDLARFRSGPIELRRDWQSVPELAGAAVQAMRPWLDVTRVRFDLPGDLPLVQVDAVLLERVFCNLLENAAKYSPAGTPIVVRAQLSGDAPTMAVAIDDQGPGFPDASAGPRFEMFERGARESTVPGVGVGLAVCRAIVEAHGGRIAASNLPAGGGRVTFELPLAAVPAIPVEAEEP